MTKRKYTRIGETPSKYQCTNKKCKWEGKEEDKKTKDEDGWSVYCCPKCGNDEFFGIL